MTSKRRFPSTPAALAAAAGVVALGLLILALSRPHTGRDVQSAAATVADRADASDATSPGVLLSELGRTAPAGDVVRVITVQGRPIGQTLKPGLWITAVNPAHPTSLAVGAVEVSGPAAAGDRASFGHAAAIVVSLAVLLGLAAAFGATVRAGRRRGRRPATHENGPKPTLARSGAVASGSDRRPLVSALMVVIDTAPDSPAGARAVRTFKQVGVETIEPQQGAAFDPRLHCVCGVIDAPSPHMVDSVAAVIRPGYIDHGFVLREADVQIYGSTRETTHAFPAMS